MSLCPGGLLLESVAELSARIHRDFTYVPGFTSITTPLSVVLKHHRGVCQDFAHLAIACLRAHGLAARYVSGYLETLPPPAGRTRHPPRDRWPRLGAMPIGSPAATSASSLVMAILSSLRKGQDLPSRAHFTAYDTDVGHTLPSTRLRV